MTRQITQVERIVLTVLRRADHEHPLLTLFIHRLWTDPSYTDRLPTLESVTVHELKGLSPSAFSDPNTALSDWQEWLDRGYGVGEEVGTLTYPDAPHADLKDVRSWRQLDMAVHDLCIALATYRKAAGETEQTRSTSGADAVLDDALVHYHRRVVEAKAMRINPLVV